MKYAFIALVLLSCFSLYRLWQTKPTQTPNDHADGRAGEHANEVEVLLDYSIRKAGALSFFSFSLLLLGGFPAFCMLAEYWPTKNAYLALAILALVTGIVLLIVSSGMRKKANDKFKEHIVRAEFGKLFDHLDYQPARRFDDAFLTSLDFFCPYDRSSGNDYVSAQYQSMHFEQCDLLLEERRERRTTDSNGKTKTEVQWVTVFQGRVMRFAFANAWKSELLVLGKRFQGAKRPAGRNWQKTETESVDFNDKFRLYASDPLGALSILKPQSILRIHDLGESMGRSLALLFTGNSLYAFFNLPRDPYEISGLRSLPEEKEQLRKDITFVRDFLESMFGPKSSLPKPLSLEGKERGQEFGPSR